MTHEIEGFLEVGSERKAWHKMGELIPPTEVPDKDVLTWAITRVKGDYEVKALPKFYQDTDKETGSKIYLPDPVGDQTIIRADSGLAIGSVGPRYTIVQNTELAKEIEPLVESLKLTLATTAVLAQGRRVFWLLKSPEKFDINGEAVEFYLLIRSAHDGQGSITILYTPIYVVCANTETVAINGAKHKIVLKHTKNVKTGLRLGVDMLRAGLKLYTEKAEEAFKYMASQDTNSTFVDRFNEHMFPGKWEPKTNEVVVNSTNRLARFEVKGLFFDGKTSSGLKNRTFEKCGLSRWGLFNTVTQYVDDTGWAESIQGEGIPQDMRQKAFDLLTQDSLPEVVYA